MMMRRRECLIVGIMMVAVSLLCFPIVAQTVLTNESIVKMVKAGLGEDVVISSIRANPGKYVTGVDELIALKGAGVSDKIIAAMGTKMAGGDAPAGAAAPVAAAAGPVNEIGVYYKKNET